MPPERLGRAFFGRRTDLVAEELVGCGLFRRSDEGLVGGIIVETEAYGGPGDPASHAAIYPRSRATVMSSQVGTTYVYRSYGIHTCFNVIAKAPGETGAVLIRAVEPTEGLDTMRLRRGGVPDRDLCRGPGRLCQAFAITLADHLDDVVVSDNLWFTAASDDVVVSASPRVGITRAVERPWRFFDAGSPFVSQSRRGVPVRGSA